jgi:hypothetical protein
MSGLDNNVCPGQVETSFGQVKFVGHLSVGISKTNKPIQKYPKGWISIENKYTPKCAIAIDKLFILVWITSINQFPCK